MKYGAYTEEIKNMMNEKLIEFIKSLLDYVDLKGGRATDNMIDMATISGASQIVDVIIKELDAVEETKQGS